MDIEKMYEDTKKKMAQHSSLEENKFMRMIKKQDKIFLKTLQELTEYYSHNKIEDTSATNLAYSNKLSALNGTTNKLKGIQENITEKIKLYDVSMKNDQKEIDNLKQMHTNLSSYTDLEHLDASSKRMLKDYISTYSNQYVMFWIKLTLCAYFMYELIKDAIEPTSASHYTYIRMWVVIMILLYIFDIIKSKMQSVVMPPAANASGVAPVDCSSNVVPMTDPDALKSSSSPTCYTSDYGCCPDGVTQSNRNGTNCNAMTVKPNACATTQYGCCPDGTTVSISDGSNCIKGCSNTEFGCCPNGVTISNKDRSNCDVPSCVGTKYGCCPNGMASNQNRSNC